MAKKDKNISYFPLLCTWLREPEIKEMMYKFRTESPEKNNMAAFAACGVYLAIIADMHVTTFKTDDEAIAAYADDFRINEDFLKRIFNDFNLFDKENGNFISQLVSQNKENISEHSINGKNGNDKRWAANREEKAKAEQFVNKNEEFIDEIVATFGEIFNIERVASDTTKLEIARKILNNKMLQDIKAWKQIFKNAKKGWTINGEVRKPSFSRILKEWDDFYSDNVGGLNKVDPEEVKKAKKQAEDQAEEQHFKEQDEKEAQRKKNTEEAKEEEKRLQEEFNAIHDCDSALSHVIQRYKGLKIFNFLPLVIKEKLECYGIDRTNFEEKRGEFIEKKGWDYEI